MKSDNISYMKQVEVSNELKSHRSNISKSVKRLTAHQFILKVHNGYMINPYFFYGGPYSTLIAKRELFNELLKGKN